MKQLKATVVIMTLALVLASVGGAMAASYYDNFSAGLGPSGWNGNSSYYSLIAGPLYDCNTATTGVSFDQSAYAVNWNMPSAWTLTGNYQLVQGYNSGRLLNADLRINGTLGNILADVEYATDSKQALLQVQYWNGSSWITVMNNSYFGGWSANGSVNLSNCSMTLTRAAGASVLGVQLNTGTVAWSGTTSAFAAGWLDTLTYPGFRVYSGHVDFQSLQLTDNTAPVPEPSSILFMVPGVAGLLGLAIRRRMS
jgi:hypothetical protein